MTDLNKHETPNYYFIGPLIEQEYKNICNNTIDKCFDNWKDIVKFDVFIEESCPLRDYDLPNLLSDIIQIINIMGNDTKYFITDGKFTWYDNQKKTWYGSNLNMANVYDNNWNRFQKETKLEVIDFKKAEKLGQYYYLFKTVIESSSAKLYKKNKQKSSKSRKSSKRRRKNIKV